MDTNGEWQAEALLLTAPDHTAHAIAVGYIAGPERAVLIARYAEGPMVRPQGDLIVKWCATYEPPIGIGTGQAALGDGRIDLNIPGLRGIGLGSLLMQPLVRWIQSRDSVVEMAPINLQGPDATTDAAMNTRNRFYEKLGFRFQFGDQRGSYGVSYPMQSSALIVPPFRLSNGWQVESTSCEGLPVFLPVSK